MAKRQLTADQKAAIKAVLVQMPDGVNWGQAESAHCIYLVAKDHGLETEDNGSSFKDAIDVFVNPSACAQFLDSLPVESGVHRKREEKGASLRQYK